MGRVMPEAVQDTRYFSPLGSGFGSESWNFGSRAVPRVAEVGAIPLRGLSSAGVARKGPMALSVQLRFIESCVAFLPKGVKVKSLIRLMILMILGGISLAGPESRAVVQGAAGAACIRTGEIENRVRASGNWFWASPFSSVQKLPSNWER
ncbi:hypothetical protein CSPX01_00530 [Colletotrichum filicis]|nr:hypothetical protein CSPX01_00530 [Colletotrichum filicis]